ncbi:MAG: aminoacetone oxidase family FAD-binding enzyme [Vicinamibacteraceae bacterium]
MMRDVAGGYDTRPIVIVGAGAAGLAAAIHAAGHGVPVVVLESTSDGGRKILISGGGRCNVLPQALEPARFVSEGPAHVVRHVLRSWPLAEQHRFFEEDVGVPLALEAESRKYFPASNRARDVRDGLVALARRRGVTFTVGARVTGLAPGPTDQDGRPGWTLALADGQTVDAGAVVMATGGCSVPQTGSDGAGLELLRGLGLRVHRTYPALTPLLASPAVHAALSGVSLTVTLRVQGTKASATGGFLFTHRGYSGPAVLDVSHHAVRAAADGRPQAILAQWSPVDDAAWHATLQGGDGLVVSRLRATLPERLAQQLVAEAGLGAEHRITSLRREHRLALVERLCRYPLPWTGDEGFRKAEVTGGGVALDDVDPGTMECRRLPGLFLCGELLDVFGPIGGHNFAWAWASGRLAGRGTLRERSRIPITTA